MISLIKLKILTPLQKLPKNVGDLGNSILAKGFEKVAQSPINHPIWSHWSWPPFRLFSAFFKQTLPQSLQQINVKIFYWLYAAGIRAHNVTLHHIWYLWNIKLWLDV